MKISFIGAGNMASAIAKGALKSNLLPQKPLFYDIQVEKPRFCTRNWCTRLLRLKKLLQ